MPVIEKRYAEALFNVCIEKGKTDEIMEDFNGLVEAIGEFTNKRDFWDHPKLGIEAKKDIFKKAIGDSVDYLLTNMIMILIDKARIHILVGVYKEFKKLVDESKKGITITITTSTHLDKEQMGRLEQKYKEKHKANYVWIENIVDPEMVGGIKVQIGDKVDDSTFRMHLDNLKKKMLNA